MMERRMRWKPHVRCGAGENLEITSKDYLSLWDPEEPTIKFHKGKDKNSVSECYKHFALYRLVKNVELADYLASRRNEELITKFKQTIETWFYIKRNIDITWDDLDKIGIKEDELRKAFAKEHEELEEFIKLALGDRYIKMKNQSLM